MALQGGQRFAVSMGDVFPDGVYAMSVEQAQDYDEKSGRRSPAKDKLTGELVWTVTVIDRDPEAREKQVKVKVSAPVQPVLPGEIAPGTGLHAVDFDRPDGHAVRVRGPGRWPGAAGVLAARVRGLRPGQGPRRFGLGSFRRAGAGGRRPGHSGRRRGPGRLSGACLAARPRGGSGLDPPGEWTSGSCSTHGSTAAHQGDRQTGAPGSAGPRAGGAAQ